jgi:hypothetical protein
MSEPNYVIELMPIDALINHARALQAATKQMQSRIAELEAQVKKYEGMKLIGYADSEAWLREEKAKVLEEVQMMYIKWYVSNRTLCLVCESVSKREELTRLLIGASELLKGKTT